MKINPLFPNFLKVAWSVLFWISVKTSRGLFCGGFVPSSFPSSGRRFRWWWREFWAGVGGGITPEAIGPKQWKCLKFKKHPSKINRKKLWKWCEMKLWTLENLQPNFSALSINSNLSTNNYAYLCTCPKCWAECAVAVAANWTFVERFPVRISVDSRALDCATNPTECPDFGTECAPRKSLAEWSVAKTISHIFLMIFSPSHLQFVGHSLAQILGINVNLVVNLRIQWIRGVRCWVSGSRNTLKLVNVSCFQKI